MIANIFLSILLIAFVISVVVSLAIVRAFTLVLLWDWFVVPTFGLESISIVAAIGLTLFVTTFENKTNDSINKDEKDEESMKEKGSKLAWQFLNYPVIILLGWIVKQFM